MAVYQLAKIGTAKLKTVLIGRSSMSQEHGFDLEVSEDDEDVAYLTLPRHPGSAPGVVKRSVSLRELVVEYDGPDVDLDFGEGNTLIGIEIVG